MDLPTPDSAERIRVVLLNHKPEILSAWCDRVQQERIPAGLSRQAIIDHFPEILEEIANLVGLHPSERAERLSRWGYAHALHRLTRGYDLDQVIIEYRLLREVIAATWQETFGSTITFGEYLVLDEALDDLMLHAVRGYASSREHLLRGLNKVSEAAALAPDLDSFLDALLKVTAEALPDADVGIIMVREGERLRTRATFGLDAEQAQAFEIAIGQGFSGKIASEGEDASVEDASSNELVQNAFIKARGVRALYGVPLIAENRVVGVAQIGSVTAVEFGDEKKLLFRTMASRAASFVAKAQLRQELAVKVEENKALYEKAQEAVATRDQLLAVVSHDMRNQLGVVTNAIAVLSLVIDTSDARVRRVMESLRRASENMKRLVADLLDTAAIREGRLSILMEPFDLEAVIESTYLAQEPLAAGSKIRLTREVGRLPRACGDAERITQVLMNLVGNAVRYCRPGDAISISGKRQGDLVEVTVADTGPGIPADKLESLFLPFETTPTGGRTGTGLGLYISQGIIERHGGKLMCESEPGVGTRFSFTLKAVLN